MSEEFGGNFVSLTDEDGNEIELEHLDTIEYNGSVYMAFFPVEEADEEGEAPQDEDEEAGLIILKVVMQDGEEQLSTVYGVPVRGRGRGIDGHSQVSPARCVMVSF